MMIRHVRTASLLAGLVLSGTAEAHPGHDLAGWTAGIAHPFTGLDHVLAMVAVGALGAVIGGRAIWALPAAFLGMMAAGGMLAFAGTQVPAVETGIGLSVLVLGLALASGRSLPVGVAAGLAGGFAIFHGQAHAAELPAAAGAAGYAAGFIAGTAVLHAVGLSAGLALGRLGQGSLALLRLGGGTMALAGLGLLAGWL
jgi:urease accessory protein